MHKFHPATALGCTSALICRVPGGPLKGKNTMTQAPAQLPNAQPLMYTQEQPLSLNKLWGPEMFAALPWKPSAWGEADGVSKPRCHWSTWSHQPWRQERSLRLPPPTSMTSLQPGAEGSWDRGRWGREVPKGKWLLTEVLLTNQYQLLH